MHDDAAFLRAIIETPDDDTPRLVYADWLDENAGTVKVCSGTHRHPGTMGFNHGVWHDSDPNYPHHHCDAKCWVSDGRRERAEFIRLQCEIARELTPGIIKLAETVIRCPGITAKLARERELLRPHNYDLWRSPISFHADTKFVRGFVQEITCAAAGWLAHADPILAAHPVRTVNLHNMSGWDARIAQFDGHSPDGTFRCSRWPGVAFTLSA